MKKFSFKNKDVLFFLQTNLKKLEFLKSKRILITFLSILFILISLIISKKIFETNFKEKINLFQLKNSYIKDIKLNFNKAAEIGISNYSIFNGIIFEDIKISTEEDFSNNKIFFSSERMDIQVENRNELKTIKKIIFYNSKLKINFSNTENEKFLKYIFDLNPLEVEFQNFEIKLFKDEKEYFKTSENFSLKMNRENSQYSWIMNDSKFFLNTFSGEGKISKLENEIFSIGKFNLNQFKIINLSGFFNELTNLNPENGDLNGVIDFQISPTETKLDGNVNILDFKGELFQFNNIGSKEFNLNSKFSYYKEQIGKNFESYFKKTLSNPDFVLDQLETISESNLKKIKINFRIDDLKNLTSKLNLENRLNVSGKIDLKVEFVETGKLNDYYLVNGLGEVKNFYLESFSPKLKISDFNMDFFWNNEKLNMNSIGKLFNKNLEFNLISDLKFQKNSDTKKIFISSTSKFDLKYSKLILEDFYSISESIYNYIYDDIKERQEKMLPESYLVLDPFYKFLVENAKLISKIEISEIEKNELNVNYGKFFLDSKLENGIANINFLKSEKEANFGFKSTIYIDRKIPTVDFRLEIENLFLNHKLFEFCDSIFYTDFLNFQFTFTSAGNNFSDFYANKSIAGIFEANSSVFIKNDNYSDKISIMENLKSQKNLSLKFAFSGYSQDLYINNLNLNSDELQIFGNSLTLRGEQGYNFSGQVKNKPFNLNFFKKGDQCYKKK